MQLDFSKFPKYQSVQELQADFPDDIACLEWIKNQVFPNGCPKCGSPRLYRLNGPRYTRAYRCYNPDINKKHGLSPAAHTIFAKSSIPLSSWFYAIYLVAQYGQETRQVDLIRQLNLSRKSAQRMLKMIQQIDFTQNDT